MSSRTDAEKASYQALKASFEKGERVVIVQFLKSFKHHFDYEKKFFKKLRKRGMEAGSLLKFVYRHMNTVFEDLRKMHNNKNISSKELGKKLGYALGTVLGSIEFGIAETKYIEDLHNYKYNLINTTRIAKDLAIQIIRIDHKVKPEFIERMIQMLAEKYSTDMPDEVKKLLLSIAVQFHK